jgi:hypothetical protein
MWRKVREMRSEMPKKAEGRMKIEERSTRRNKFTP